LLFDYDASAQVPTIISFSPKSGPIGTTVTITGTNFSTIAFNDIVYFGAVRANVVSSSATSLNVTVPIGTTNQPLTVTTNGLTAYSNRSFIVTFTGGENAFSVNSFATKIDSTVNAGPVNSVINDLDGDGKPDIIIGNEYPFTITIYRNTSINGTISLASKLNLITACPAANSISIGDMDGDGKPDIVTANKETGLNKSSISIFRNTSLNDGNISFANRIDLPVTAFTYDNLLNVSVNDLDGDGRPDIVAVDSTGYMEIFKNTSTDTGNISFAPELDYQVPYYPSSIGIVDIDGDSKPDIVINSTYLSKIYVYKNTSTASSISFVDTASYSTGSTPIALALEDLDGDGKADIVVANYQSNNISTFRNTSTIGNFSFNSKVDYSVGKNPKYITIGDLNGDGKPDIAVADYGSDSVTILKNISTIDSISFALKVDYLSGNVHHDTYNVSIGDLNGDNKTDLIVANAASGNISILRNQIGEPIVTQLCPLIGNTTLRAFKLGANYQWQLSSDSIHYNDINNSANYNGVNSDTLQLNNISSSWYGYQYRCNVDGFFSDIFTLKFTDTWVGSINSVWENPANWSCGTVPDFNTDVKINIGTVVVNSNVTVRSLSVSPGASFTVNPPYNLTVTH